VFKPAVRKEVLLASLDFAACVATGLVAMRLRYGHAIPPEHEATFYAYLLPFALWRLFMALCFQLYDFRRRLTWIEHCFGACGAGLTGVLPGYVLLALVQLYGSPITQFSRIVAALDLLLLLLWFTLSRGAVLLLLRRTGYRVQILLIGQRADCETLAEEIAANAPKMVRLAGLAVFDRDAVHGEVLGAAKDLETIIDTHGIDQAILATTDVTQTDLHDVIVRAARASVELFVHPDLDLSLLVNTRVVSIAGLALLPLSPAATCTVYGMGKRGFDVAAAVLLLVLSLPFAVAAAIAIALSSKGPVFFSQERVGLYGRPFRILKFRTMVVGAEAESGPALAVGDDPRLTPVGAYLRRLRIDEIPQLWNVLRGEMSFIGPRPERPPFVHRYIAENPLYQRRLLVKPGLTGLAQIHGRYDTDYRNKLRYDLIYINSISLATDLRILFATIRIILTGKGAR